MSADPTRAQLRGGDPLRGLASLGVLIGHVAVYTLAAVLAVDVATLDHADVTATWGLVGWVMAVVGNGVWVFFVLSGYLIARPAIGAWVRGAPQPGLRRYARNRLLRIVPAFWVVVVATLVVLGPQGSSALEVLAVPAFLQVYAGSAFAESIGQAWTLDSELAFYVLVPLAGLALARLLPAGRGSREQRAVAVVVLAGAIAVASLASSLPFARDATHLRWAPAILFAFMPGVALAGLEHLVPARLARLRGAAGVATAVALLGVATFAASVSSALPAGSGRVVVVLGSGLVLAGVLLRQWATGTTWRVLDNAPLRWLGERSYSVYLVHVLVLLLLVRLLPDGADAWWSLLLVGGAGTAISLVLSDLLYRGVELPFLRLRSARSSATAATSEPTSPAQSSGASVPTTVG